MRCSILIFLFAPFLAFGQISNNSIFAGGSGDGYDGTSYEEEDFYDVSSIFGGGTGDGYDKGDYEEGDFYEVSNIFAGGDGDGYDKGSYTEEDFYEVSSIFSGGNGDGYDKGSYTEEDFYEVSSIFGGGLGDGYDLGLYEQEDFYEVSLIFRGGQGDGYAMDSIQIYIFLPLNLINFSARYNLQTENVDLTWTSSHEEFIINYEVIHSTGNWKNEVVASVPSENSYGKQQYTAEHINPPPGSHYYQLRWNEQDGSTGQSDWRHVEIVQEGDFTFLLDANLIPHSQPTISGQITEEAELKLMDAAGREIGSRIVPEAGFFLWIPKQSISAGIYYLSLAAGDRIYTKRIVFY